MKKVTLTLTLSQAQELRLVAGNGYGDGDFYDGSYGNRRTEKSYLSAMGKLEDAIEKATGDKFSCRMGPKATRSGP